ncbi:MAG: AlpA family phage regulatory protein [Pseudorhodobacter sp.]|nr:AlpA family phage regulatory protein [Pseudorhodobacter sp.]
MNVAVHPDNLFLSVNQVAERYHVSSDSIWRWKRSGDFPTPVRIGPNCTRWRLVDLIEHESQLKTCFAVSADWLLAA